MVSVTLVDDGLVPMSEPSTKLSWQSLITSTKVIRCLVSSTVYAHGYGATLFVNFLGEYSVSVSGLILSSIWLDMPRTSPQPSSWLQTTFYRLFSDLFDVLSTGHFSEQQSYLFPCERDSRKHVGRTQRSSHAPVLRNTVLCMSSPCMRESTEEHCRVI